MGRLFQTGLVGITRREIARYFRSLIDIPADRNQGRRRAGAIGLLKTIIAAVEARDHARAAVAAGRLGIDQRLHFVAPFAAFIAPANAPEVVQSPEDLRE